MDPRFVYADNAATTPVAAEVVNAMLPHFTAEYGNPSSIYYKLGERARVALQKAREQVAALMGAEPREVYFTGSGTEADNIALRGLMLGPQARGRRHFITTAIEHHAILHTAQALEKDGFRVTYLPVDRNGLIDLARLDAAIGEDTALVSIIAANNEIGTIQDIAAIGALCKKRGVFFHTDAVQAFGHIPLDVKAMNIDMMSVSAHKINGSKGVGALYVRDGLRLTPVVTGGGQESNLRSGTENVPAIVGFGEAARLAGARMEREHTRLSSLSKKLTEGVLAAVPQSMVTGHPTGRLPGLNSFVFTAIEGESMVIMMDAHGICCSTGSACSTGSLDPSHVLMAIGLTHDRAHGSLRLSLGPQSTEADIDYILDKLPGIVQKLRDMSPVWKG